MRRLDDIIDELELIIHNARKVPFAKQVMIDPELILEKVDELRLSLPEELKKAYATLQEQDRIIKQAHERANIITANAVEQARAMVSETSIMKAAREEASNTVKAAQDKADEVKRAADSYAVDRLRQLEAYMMRSLEAVRQGLAELQQGTNIATISQGYGTSEDKSK